MNLKFRYPKIEKKNELMNDYNSMRHTNKCMEKFYLNKRINTKSKKRR